MSGEPLAKLFATTFMYSQCKLSGPNAWPTWLKLALERLDVSVWPGLRTLGQLSRVCEYDLHVDGSTYITRARSVAVGHFLRSAHDVWLTVDDDVYVQEDVLRRVILACRATRGGIALPYMNRDGHSMTFRKVSGPTLWLTRGGVPVARGLDGVGVPPTGDTLPLRVVDRVGFGCVALHRDLVEALAADAPKFREKALVGEVDCPALFLEGAQEGEWVGEDFYFSALAERAGRPLHVLLCAPCEHAGIAAMLDDEGQIRVRDPEHARILDMSLRAKEALVSQDRQTEKSQGG
jgi:hypothetical protein